MALAENGVGPVMSSWPAEKSSSSIDRGRASTLGGVEGVAEGGRWSLTCTLAAARRFSFSVPCSSDQGCQASVMSRASTLRPFCSQCSSSTWPPARSEPLAFFARSGCEASTQRRAAASEPSVPAHHHNTAMAPKASATAPPRAEATFSSQRRAGFAPGAGVFAFGVRVACIRRQNPR